MITAPFLPYGNSVQLTTNGAASTSNSLPVQFKGAGFLNVGDALPTQIRLMNTGASIIWLSFTNAAAASVIPVAGTTTLGTPQPVIFLAPNILEVFTLPIGIQPLVGVAGTPLGFWLNTISTGVSQTFLMQLGEGA